MFRFAFRQSARRSFATAKAAPDTVLYSRKGDQVEAALPAVKTVSKTASGITVATYDHLGPVSSLALVLKAGSRFETAEAPGVTHLLKKTLVRVKQQFSYPSLWKQFRLLFVQKIVLYSISFKNLESQSVL